MFYNNMKTKKMDENQSFNIKADIILYSEYFN